MPCRKTLTKVFSFQAFSVYKHLNSTWNFMCMCRRTRYWDSENKESDEMLRQVTRKPEQPGKWWKTEDWERAT